MTHRGVSMGVEDISELKATVSPLPRSAGVFVLRHLEDAPASDTQREDHWPRLTA
jgi:hypothetical protein